jgi:hypothetical protein
MIGCPSVVARIHLVVYKRGGRNKTKGKPDTESTDLNVVSLSQNPQPSRRTPKTLLVQNVVHERLTRGYGGNAEVVGG